MWFANNKKSPAEEILRGLSILSFKIVYTTLLAVNLICGFCVFSVFIYT